MSIARMFVIPFRRNDAIRFPPMKPPAPVTTVIRLSGISLFLSCLETRDHNNQTQTVFRQEDRRESGAPRIAWFFAKIPE